MVFSSIPFIFAFLPAVVLAERITHDIRIKNYILLIASLFFYAYGEPVYIFLMLISILLNHCLAYAISKKKESGKSGKEIEAAAVFLNLGALFAFKYAQMAVSLLNKAAGSDFPVPSAALPIGISFYTFQALSYVIDVRRGNAKANRNPLFTALYISFFPQLIAGPIVKYSDIGEQIRSRKEEPEMTADGISRFVLGLSKKVLLANRLSEFSHALYTVPPASMGMGCAWIAAAAYALNIYYDFSGYSDMAIGLGKIFGFQLKENFIAPYTSCCIKDFWRRWHISLSSWFKEYLYIPLGGNRKGRFRTVLNKFVVFAFTGIWHGANLAFLIWGLWHGMFLMLEEVLSRKDLSRKDQKPSSGSVWFRMIGRVYTFVVVSTGFVLFGAGMDFTDSFEALAAGWDRIRAMFIPGFSIMSDFAAAMIQRAETRAAWTVFGAAFLLAVFSPKSPKGRKIVRGITWAAVPLLALACAASLAGGAYNPFIYFQF